MKKLLFIVFSLPCITGISLLHAQEESSKVLLFIAKYFTPNLSHSDCFGTNKRTPQLSCHKQTRVKSETVLDYAQKLDTALYQEALPIIICLAKFHEKQVHKKLHTVATIAWL